MFWNLKIAHVKSNGRSSYSIFLFTKLFFIFFFFFIICTLEFWFFSNFNAQIFYNFPNFIFFEFLKFLLINKFCKYLKKFNFVKYIKKKINYENLTIFKIVKILEVC